MQGQRGTVGSLPETLDFDLGSSSNNAAMDQQMCWNNVRNPPENHIPDYLLTQTEMNIAFVNSMSRERQSLGRWCPNEASSSNTQNEAGPGERKLELGWPSSGSSCPMAGPRLDEQHRQQQQQCRDPPNNVVVDNSANLMFAQSSNPNAPVQPSLNLGFVGHSGSNSQVMPFPTGFKFGVSENEPSRGSSGSDHFRLPPRNGGFLAGEDDGRQVSVDGPRMSCKRKSIEGSMGPSSSGGSCSYFQRTDSSSRPGLCAPNGSGSGLSIYNSSEQVTPGLVLGFPDPIVAENPEVSHRNVRMRTNSSTQQNSASPSILSSGRAVRRSGLMSSHPSMSLLPVDHSLDLIRPISAGDSVRNPTQLAPIDVPPPLLQNSHSLRWSGASASRSGGPSGPVGFGDRDALPREELSSRTAARTVPDRPIPAAELRNLVRHPAIRSVAAVGGANPHANSGSSSRAGSSGSNANPALAPVWQPHNIPPPHYPRRFSEYLRRSLFASAGTEPGGQRGNYLPLLRAGQPGSSSPSQEGAGPPGGGHHQPHARLASWLERHNEGGLGVPYSLRALGAGGEGSSRIVSEIRNVLGLIRRGESLRFEDVMILDPAVFAGVADIHDRHRDMRLDVDNMSYEELLALEERIGNVSTGLTEEIVSKRLKNKQYLVAGKSQSESEPCCICQEDYNEGENVGTLECGHDFHTDCIKQWLSHKNLCPICKTTALKS